MHARVAAIPFLFGYALSAQTQTPSVQAITNARSFSPSMTARLAGINPWKVAAPREIPLGQPSHGYGNLPLAFEPNVGQTDARVRFLARGGGMTAFFADTETVMVLTRSRRANKPDGPGHQDSRPGEIEQAVVRMKLTGASQRRRPIGLERLPGISNYFLGNDPAKWRTDVPRYARVQYGDVYPGIDLVWYGNRERLEYDFVVAPGADPKQIRVAYEGAESLRVEANGDLVLRTRLGEVRQQKPHVYQESGGNPVEVATRYAIMARNRVGFELAGYDRNRELCIDPVVLVYSTYLAGGSVGLATSSDDGGSAIAVDGTGSVYVTGTTGSPKFPTQAPYQAKLQGAENVFVTKLTPGGNALVYSTYLGGSGFDAGRGIAVDGTGSAYITGYTRSANFPTQSPYQANRYGFSSAFVTKLTPGGNALVYSTYLGGGNFDAHLDVADSGNGIAVDGTGSAYITGFTYSRDFPTQSPYQAKLQGYYNAFVTKLTPAGNALVYSTYLGGSDYDSGNGIAVGGTGSAYITGYTYSTDFPTQSPYQAKGRGNAFVTKLTSAGNALVYSTYLGGNGDDFGEGIAVDGTGPTSQESPDR
jgi:hypothetical protein